MGEAEWNATPWHVQRAYLEGLEQDPDVPFKLQDAGELPDFTRRVDVDAGTDVIDLAAMRAEMEAQRRQPGGP